MESNAAMARGMFPKRVTEDVLHFVKLELAKKKFQLSHLQSYEELSKKLTDLEAAEIGELVSRDLFLEVVKLARQLADLLVKEKEERFWLEVSEVLRTSRRSPGRPHAATAPEKPKRRLGAPRKYSNGFHAYLLWFIERHKKNHPESANRYISDKEILEAILRDIAKSKRGSQATIIESHLKILQNQVSIARKKSRKVAE